MWCRIPLPGLALAAAVLIPLGASAQEWPTRPVRILVGSAPGGGTDAMARAVADRLSPLLKQPTVVENRPGASNTLAADATARSTDGHTMVMGVVTAHAIAPHLLKLAYDNNRDLVPVAFVGAVPNVLVVTNALPAQSVKELVALAKKAPGTINFASSGAGSTQHIAAEMFKDAAGIDLMHVPYKGSGTALVDLVGGQVQMSFDTMPSVLGQIKSAKMRALAVTTPQRNPQLPQVPTMAEAGLPQVDISAWYGIYMPAATPKAVQQKVHDAVNEVLAMPETQTRLGAVGAELKPISQAEFIAFQNAEFKRYGDLIRKNNIRID
ncbi:tripartite tricarboxylate transporter substrate binding protein [Acidovorax sp. SUPP2522]|uniref:Bug family tripartite tricarboxylate transporter substrate binding protein n=1 Tax=unclassified Acidovorax TaxID=2684926 RepID=UPI00234B0E85|nr:MULTISPECIES: tripartite tricarboxylate transporter substrate binding protein [unclassified Acidovorax]WCM97801.1 tripartite tricarboxylate transporter substrate binding protein [Acidovorax sp. GBBC 1281]GKT13445.1 tripartite tricarboxylate transporter substrate binding protein [Acidovorax sp. SUPP2522]